MNVYFSCSLTGGRRDEATYGAIVDRILALGHDVPTAHLAHPEVMALERVSDAAAIYRRDVAWVTACDALVAEVSTPSHGVGYEVCLALRLGKPVLCCHRREATVSKMILGNDSAGLQVRAYDQPQDALRAVEEFLASLDGRGRPPASAAFP
jgi:hypothetical protein